MERFTSAQRILKEVSEKAEEKRQVEAEKRENRKRVVFMRRLVALSFLMVGMFTMVSFANGLFDETVREENRISAIEEKIAKFDQVEVVVQKGDTAWTIQEKLTPNYGDMRDMLYYVEYVNKRNSIGDIKAGETLIFLKAKDSK
jgi:hypothetical protein